MCCVGDIGESLEDPISYSINTLREMQILGMDPQKENWDNWTIDVREEEMKKRIHDFNPSLFEYFKDVLGKWNQFAYPQDRGVHGTPYEPNIPPIAIRFINVWKHFKDRDVEALGGIDLEVFQGEFVSLIGPSGSGKSTLLELLGDIGDEGGPSEGKILIDGKTPEELRMGRGYGIVFQDSTLFPWYRVFENCLLPFRIAKSQLSKRRTGEDGLNRSWRWSISIENSGSTIPRNSPEGCSRGSPS